MVKFGIRHLLTVTAIVAIHFLLRSIWLSFAMPANAAIVPLSLTAMIAVLCGWTQRTCLVAGAWSAVTGCLSAALIAAEVLSGSQATQFLYTVANNTRFHSNLSRNALAIVMIAIASGILGAALSRFTDSLVSSIRDRRWSRTSALIALGGTVAMATLLVMSLRKITDRNRERVQIGMTQTQVEKILGPPNPLPDLKRKNEAFWDAKTHFGRRYVAIHIAFDEDSQVKRVEDHGFWNARPWLFW